MIDPTRSHSIRPMSSLGKLRRLINPANVATPETGMSAHDPGSITHLFDDLRAGRAEAAEALWERYFKRLVGVARRRLVDAPHQAVEDAEDAALSALHGLYSGAAQGRFENLADRADLWRLLVAITVKKTLEQQRRHGRKKRGGDLRLINSTDLDSDDSSNADPLDAQADPAPPPDTVLILEDQLHELLDALGDPVLKQIAICRMEGLSAGEIALNMGCVVRTVERKIERIRLIWQERAAHSNV